MLDFLDSQESLDEFLKKHVKAYDPATNDYERPPFAADIKEGKNDPIYNIHSYHTKVPPRGIVPYILHYTKPGDLILDPFCGSGMTGVATQMCSHPPVDILQRFSELKDRLGPRACILNDLSPAACHIAYNYNTPVDVNALTREFEEIKAAVNEEVASLYRTEHYEPAIGEYELTNPELITRLKNPPCATHSVLFPTDIESNWILLTRAEVEERLGYPVTSLPRERKWKYEDVSKVKYWICIPATIQYTIWSDVYTCAGFVKVKEPTGRISRRGKNAGKPIYDIRRVQRGCGGDIILWDVAVDPQTKSFSEFFKCPNPKCEQTWDKLALALKTTLPMWISYTFRGLNKSISRRDRPVAIFDKQKLSVIEGRGRHPFFPDVLIDNGRELMTMGPANRGMKYLLDFYTYRNQWALGTLWKHIFSNKTANSNIIRFAFTAILDVASRRNRFPQQAVMSGTLYVPSIQIEMNVLSQFERRVAKVITATNADVNQRLNESFFALSNNDARDMSWIPDNTIDYIFTDPPFGGNIYYADASILVEAWIGKQTDETKELVFNRQRRQDQNFKSLVDYNAGMITVFKEMHRVLKPGRFCTVEFNNSDGAVFAGIKTAALAAGFQILNMLLLDKSQKSFKQVKGDKGEEDVVDKDVIFNLRKLPITMENISVTTHDLEQQIFDVVRKHLHNLPERIKAEPAKYDDDHRTTSTINSMLMNALIPKGVNVESLNLPYIEQVCARYFRKIGQRWYLRGEAVGNGTNSNLFEEEIQIKDEESAIAWLRQKLTSGPKAIGELKPVWMRATGLLSLEIFQQFDLDALLRENFWKDPDTNRWREPSPEEREKMNDSQTLHVVHDAERYLAGTLKRQTGDIDRCDWIDVLFKACRAIEEQETEELPALWDFDPTIGYQMITHLFHGVLKDQVPADIFGRAEKQARVASSRLKGAAENGKQENQESKDKIQLEFDL